MIYVSTVNFKHEGVLYEAGKRISFDDYWNLPLSAKNLVEEKSKEIITISYE